MTNETEAVRAEPVVWISDADLCRARTDDRGILAPVRTVRRGRTVPLYPASEIDRLTGEVERLREYIKTGEARWNKAISAALRTELAERRVAELVESARAFLAASDAYDSAETSSSYPDHQSLLSQYKWSRQEFEDSLTQPEADHG
jgi:hypothetical protein